ncbi:MAG: MarR family transcriptional regulator [Nonlabens sp.]|uniref:MarR family winged helix-turn-helix transcriptional regulator n=1 Tax=Nonlabens sp. TaxID=1888209 RepID=UPI00321A5A1D
MHDINKHFPKENQLKLESQVCFPLYSASRLMTKAYKPYLDKMGITYPQYLVLLILWETDAIAISEITDKLLLNTNTVSPLLKRMEKSQLIERNKCCKDERSILISLTKKGLELKNEANKVPEKLLQVLINSNIALSDIIHLKETLDEWINELNENKK